MSRKKQLSDIDPFGAAEKTSPNAATLPEIDQALFGKIAEVDAGRQVIKALPIHEIYPDPTQPRRAMPSLVRRYWQGIDSMPDLFSRWLELVSQERGSPFELSAYFEADADVERPAQPGPFEETLLKVVDLALSIKRDGLTNPITVQRVGRQYRIETGERRWLAYHLLSIYFRDEQWHKIPARQVNEFSVWRQASENNARDDLNAIGKARQFALLLMDLYQQAEHEQARLEDREPKQLFKPMKSDRAYYAQIADAKRYRVPTGRSDLLVNAMGLRHRSQLTHYRAFLSLPDPVWQMGDDYNLTDETLYELSRMEPEAAIEAAQKIVVGHNNLAQKPAPPENPLSQYPPGTKRHFASLAQVIKKAGHGKPEVNAQALHYIREMRAWLDEQEQRIQQWQ